MTLLKIIIAVVWLVVADDAIAKDLFKYQDENGQWVFTDQAPTDVEVAPEQIETQVLEFYEPQRLVKIQNNGPRDEPRLYAINDSAAPVEVRIRFSKKTRNVLINGSRKTREVRMVVPPRSEKVIAKIEPLKDKKWRYNYAWNYTLGSPVSKIRYGQENPYPYGYPFNSGTAFRVSQGFNGAFSHDKTTSKYAVDISMPEGTPVVAARAGVVVSFEDVFFRSGTSEEFYDRSNFVRILHEDDTIAGYFHLKLDTVEVNIGDRVTRNQRLGLSGTTGYSQGPHLHFVLQQNQGMRLTSIPFRFVDSRSGKKLLPQRGDLLSNP